MPFAAKATAVMFGISYAVGIFPPNDLKILKKQEFALATAAKLLALDGQGRWSPLLPKPRPPILPCALPPSQEASPSACSGSSNDEAVPVTNLRMPPHECAA